ncbi:hypothetical protein DFAR_3060032 [Desulfarculales bacterium]
MGINSVKHDISAHEVAVRRGYRFISGHGKAKGDIWLCKFTKQPHGGEAIWVGYDYKLRRWIVEEEG